MDDETLNRIAQFSDVLKIDGTIPEFYDNVDKAGITEMPWLIGFAERVPFYKGPYGDRFNQEYGGKYQGYRDMLNALEADQGENNARPANPAIPHPEDQQNQQ